MMTQTTCKKLIIRDQILMGNLFNEEGYDEYASAENLAILYERVYRDLAEADFPDAEIDVHIDVRRTSGWAQPLDIAALDEDGMDADVDTDDLVGWYTELVGRAAETEYEEWAVEADEE